MFVFVVRTIYIKIENVSILLCNSRYFLIYSYKIFIQVGLTGNENGQEEDYMSLDLVAEIASLEDEFEFEILSHGVM